MPGNDSRPPGNRLAINRLGNRCTVIRRQKTGRIQSIRFRQLSRERREQELFAIHDSALQLGGAAKGIEHELQVDRNRRLAYTVAVESFEPEQVE
jgi:hypothetical protein